MARAARSREPERTGTDRVPDLVRHRAQVVLAGLVFEGAFTHHVGPQGRVPDVAGVVDRLGQAVDHVHELGKGLPLPGNALQHGRPADVFRPLEVAEHEVDLGLPAGCNGKPAVPHHRRRDTVVAGATAELVPEDLGIHVGMAIHEAGGHHVSLGVDHLVGGLVDPADRGDNPVLHANVGAVARHAGSVDHHAVPDHQVEAHYPLPSTSVPSQAGIIARGCDLRHSAGMHEASSDYLVEPDPRDPLLTRRVEGVDHEQQPVTTSVVVERPLTLFLNSQEIVTAMTIGDYPDMLAIGFLLNQNMLLPTDRITGVDHDDDLGVVVVRTERSTVYEERLRRQVRTSGCAQGTVFGDLIDTLDEVTLPGDAVLRTSWIYGLTRRINTTPSLYLEAGAIHGCVLCREDRPLVYMEDVGRHNAIDKIAGYMFVNGIDAADKIFYTTGRLTSEMVIKTVRMGIPILVSRSGFTAWGVELARQTGLTLVGRARGKRFIALSGEHRIVYDADPARAEVDVPRRNTRRA